jgi:hypothetical protein
MDLLMMTEIDNRTTEKLRTIFGELNITKRKFFISRGEEAVVVSRRDKLRDAFLAARHYRKVIVYPLTDYGAAMELSGALREAGIESGIYPFSLTKEEKGRIPRPPFKVKVGVILPNERELLTWNIPELDFFNVMELKEKTDGFDVVGSTGCSTFPTYDVRILVTKVLLPFKSYPLTIEMVDEDGMIKVNTPCNEVDGMFTLIRPNQWFTRFEVHEGELRSNVFRSFARNSNLFTFPTGMTFLAVGAPSTAVSAYLRERLGFNL